MIEMVLCWHLKKSMKLEQSLLEKLGVGDCNHTQDNRRLNFIILNGIKKGDKTIEEISSDT